MRQLGSHYVKACFRPGVGLIELLIALAISATLLTAVAVALDASFSAYKVNQEQSTLTQRSRLAINRMLGAIRMTREHSPLTSTCISNFAKGATVTDIAIQMFDDSGTLEVYRYDATKQQLLAEKGGVSHVLLEGVSHFQVTMQPMKSANAIKTGGAYDLLKRATILLTVKSTDLTSDSTETTGQQKLTLSSSVAPRQNLW